MEIRGAISNTGIAASHVNHHKRMQAGSEVKTDC